MSQQTINVGASPNDGTGTPLRTAFQYTNSNFSELYTAVGPSGNNIVVPGSATITGDLTVDTSTLKVDSTNNRVGVGTASPAYTLDVFQSGAATIASSFAMARFSGSNAVANDFTLVGPNTSQVRLNFSDPDLNGVGEIGYDHSTNRMRFVANGNEQYRIDPSGVFTWLDGAGGTRMTLNSTGLGIGATPVEKLTVAGAAEITGGVVGQGAYILRDGATGGGTYSAKTGNVSLSAPASGFVRFNVNNGTLAGQFDVSGNFIPTLTATAPTLSANRQMVFNLTSDTNLRISVRGADGTTRTANITLA